MSRDQPARVRSGARDAVIPPDARRFAIQKVDRLHLTWMEECHNEIPHDADIFNIEDKPVRRSLCNAQSVDGIAGEVIDLFKVEYLAFLHLIGREVFAAVSWLRAGQSVGVHN